MSRERERGAAAVEFVLIATLLVLLLFGVLQVGVYFYARNIVAASAADGARYAASAGVPPGVGAVRAQQLIADALGRAQASAIRCTSGAGVDADSGLPITTVRCVRHIRTHGVTLDLPMTVDFTSSALRESTP